MQIIFQTCSEFDAWVFYKNRILKKSFLKVLINPIFVIFCFFLVTKIEQKISKIWLMRTFKNDLFKNLFLQKDFLSNSEQVWKMICMVEINSLTSRSIFHDFLVIFGFFGLQLSSRALFSQYFSNLCTLFRKIYKRDFTDFFVRARDKHIVCLRKVSGSFVE